MNMIGEIVFIVLAIAVFIWLWWGFSPLKCLLIAIINIIYGTLLLSTLSNTTPGFYLVLIVGGVLNVIGIIGFFLWLKMIIKINKDESNADIIVRGWLGFVKSFDIVLILGLLFRALILQPFAIEGPSMEPNFYDRQIIIVDKVSYLFKEPKRGDVIIFQAPKTPQDDYIKRIIALPGEKITISNGNVYINGSLLQEPYMSQKTLVDKKEGILNITIGQNEYFVMGDNRANSSDSRDWGLMPKDNIIGKPWIRVIPWDTKGIINSFEPNIINDQQINSSAFNDISVFFTIS